jgi:hypothetical protein
MQLVGESAIPMREDEDAKLTVMFSPPYGMKKLTETFANLRKL